MAYFSDETFSGLTELQPGEYDNCVFDNCSFPGMPFGNCRFTDCEFVETDLSNADFNEAKLQTVAFDRCKLIGARLAGADAFLLDLVFSACRLELADCSGLVLKGASFNDCRLRETTFIGTDLREADFTGSDLTGADFEGADLREADLSRAECYIIHPSKTRLRGTKVSRAGLAGLGVELGLRVV